MSDVVKALSCAHHSENPDIIAIIQPVFPHHRPML